MIKIFVSILLVFSLPAAFAQRSGNLTPTDNYDYRVDAKGASWVLEVQSTSQYTGDGIPKSLSSRVKIEKKDGKKSVKTHQIDIAKFPHEDGVLFIDIANMNVPLFLVVSRSPELPESDREIHLISPLCRTPIDSVRAQIEDSSQIQINTGVKDFMVSYPTSTGSGKKTWTLPESSSNHCQQKWR